MRKILFFLVTVGLVGALAWGIITQLKNGEQEAEGEHSAAIPSRAKDGVVTIDEKTFSQSGLATIQVTAVQGQIQIPASAIMWWNGKAWAYVKKSANAYARKQVSIEGDLHDGLYTVTGISDGAAVITTGAQLLLSEELRTSVTAGEDD